MTTTAAVMYAPSPFVNMYGTPYFAGGTADQSQLQHAMPSMAPAMSPQQVVFLPQPANMLPTHPFQPYFVPVMSYPMPTGAPGMPMAPQPVFPQFALPVPSAHDATSMNMATAAIKLQQAPAPAMSVRVGAPREASDKDSHVSSEEAHAQHQLGGAKLRGVPAGNPPPTRSIIGALRFSECRQKRPVVPVAIPQAPKGEREARQLVVNYLAAEITSQHLAQLFSQFGSVEGCRVITDTTTNVSKGFAFVYMGSQEEALHVIASASGRVLLSKRIKVAFADPQVPLASFKSAAEAPFSPLDASSTTTPTSASRGDARRQ